MLLAAIFLCVAQRALLIHSTALNNKYSSSLQLYCKVFSLQFYLKKWKEVIGEEGGRYSKTTVQKGYLAP